MNGRSSEKNSSAPVLGVRESNRGAYMSATYRARKRGDHIVLYDWDEVVMKLPPEDAEEIACRLLEAVQDD